MPSVLSALSTVSSIKSHADSVMGKESQSKETGELHGRKYHWTTYVIGGGAVAGVVTLVAAAILGMYATAAAGAIIAVTNGIAFWRQKDYEILKPLSEFSKDLDQSVDHIENYVGDLKDFNANTKIQREKFEKEAERYKKIHKESKKALTQLNQKHTELVNKSESHLKRLQGQLKNFEQGILLQERGVNDLSSKTIEFGKIKEDISNLHQQINSDVSEINKYSTSYVNENRRLEENNKKLSLENLKLQKLVESLKKQLDEISLQKINVCKTGQDIGENVSKLDKENDQTEKTVLEYEKLVKKEQKILDERKVLKEQIDIIAKVFEEIGIEKFKGSAIEKIVNIMKEQNPPCLRCAAEEVTKVKE